MWRRSLFLVAVLFGFSLRWTSAISPLMEESHMITPSSVTPHQGFGKSMAISADGTILVVGSPRRDNNQGAVYVYTLDDSNGNLTWTEAAVLVAGDRGDSDVFGFSVSVSGNGERIAIGAPKWEEGNNNFNGPYDDHGAVYMFERSGDTWSQTVRLTRANPQRSDRFGSQVRLSVDGEVLLVTNNPIAPARVAVRVLQRVSGTEWRDADSFAPSTSAAFGSTGPAVGATPSLGLVAVRLSDGEAVQLLRWDGSALTPVTTLTPPPLNPPVDRTDMFGFHVTVDPAGQWVWVGVPRRSLVAVYQLVNGTWTFSRLWDSLTVAAREMSWLGSSLHFAPPFVLAGAPVDPMGEKGSAFLFRFWQGEWIEERTLRSAGVFWTGVDPQNLITNDNFGVAVVVGQNYSFVAADNENAVYVFPHPPPPRQQEEIFVPDIKQVTGGVDTGQLIGLIVGIIVGGIIILALAAVAGALLLRYLRKRKIAQLKKEFDAKQSAST